MGTSQSNPSPGDKSPLIPPWADDEPGTPKPEPAPSRHLGFRQSLGRYISSGDRSELNKSLGHFSRTTTGGGSTASRRLGSATTVGAELYSVLSNQTGFNSLENKTIKFSDLAGKSLEYVIETLLQALTPDNEDAERIRNAMNDALFDALEGVTEFDPNDIDNSLIFEIMFNYLTEIIFLHFVFEAGGAWEKANTPSQIVRVENEIRELIKVVVDNQMSTVLDEDKIYSEQEFKELQKHVIQEVWDEWRSFQ